MCLGIKSKRVHFVQFNSYPQKPCTYGLLVIVVFGWKEFRFMDSQCHTLPSDLWHHTLPFNSRFNTPLVKSSFHTPYVETGFPTPLIEIGFLKGWVETRFMNHYMLTIIMTVTPHCTQIQDTTDHINNQMDNY